MITLTIASLGTISGRLYAIEQLTTMAGSNEDECNRIFNCKIKTENAVKYPDSVSPFDKSGEIGKTMTSNVNDAKKIQEQSCQKLMQVDIEQKRTISLGNNYQITWSVCHDVASMRWKSR